MNMLNKIISLRHAKKKYYHFIFRKIQNCVKKCGDNTEKKKEDEEAVRKIVVHKHPEDRRNKI